MKFATSATLAVACLLLAQVAFAEYAPAATDPSYKPAMSGDKYGAAVKEPKAHDMLKAKDGSKDAYGADKYATTDNKKAAKPAAKPDGMYCIPDEAAKVNTKPGCPAGYTYSEKYNKCYKYGADACGKGAVMTKDSYGAHKCVTCKDKDATLIEGECVSPCKKDCASTKINGERYCVSKCKEGETAVGTDCVDFNKCKASKCSAKACGLGSKLYFKQGSSYYADAYAAKDAYGKPSENCVCAPTKSRQVEPQKCDDPKMKDPKTPMTTCDAKCNDGSKPDAKGECGGNCPTGCTSKNGKCYLACPAGHKHCSTKKHGDFCAKMGSYGTYGAGYDACEVVEKMEHKLKAKKDCTCPKPAAPKPAAKPSPKPAAPVATKPAVPVTTKPAPAPAAAKPKY